MAFQFKNDFWYLSNEIVEETSIGRDTLAYWRSKGGGPEYSKIGKRIFCNGTTLTEFFYARLRKSTSDNGSGVAA